MKKVFTIFLLIFIVVVPQPVLAVQNPLSVPNNKFGVHILFSSELDRAAELVNSSGGQWGYVIIPIQAGDRDLEKWQGFMDKAKELHVIPILRLATEGDYFNTKVWRAPNDSDVLDFSNFLNSLTWPTKNRYIIAFNEPNRGDEWGGAASPPEYANILSYTVSVFKSKSPDFFIISAGLDNAAANDGKNAFDEFYFLKAMNEAVPGIFNQIDGLSSHSYPNPAFSQPPNQKPQGVSSFKFERALARELGARDLPIFITETGWSKDRVSDYIISLYYKDIFTSIWADSGIVAITPFLLSANAGPFMAFSLIQSDGTETAQYKVLKSLPKINGAPILPELQITALESASKRVLGTRNFSNHKTNLESSFSEINTFKGLLKWLLKL